MTTGTTTTTAAPQAGLTGAAGGGGAGGGGPLAGLIQADAATNSLIITAPEPLYRNIRAIIDKLDVRRAQVVIESLIVEMTADKAAEFGIQWQALGAVNNSDYGVVASQNFGTAGTNIIGVAGNLSSVGQGLNLGVINGKINIPGVGEVINLAFLARALETTADANILSTPTIQTLDNEEAKFLVGQNIPLITGSYAAAGGNTAVGVNPFQTFERKDIGLQLRVKPQISEGGVVRLAIYQELSSIQNTLTAAQGGIITNKRSFESTVLVEDGNIVVLGGLIEDRTDNSRSSLPILGRIPGLGYLFSYENRGRKKTNLLVFLRPYVVRDESTSNALALDRYAYIRGQVATNSKPDNVIFKGFQSTQLPEQPPVPPAMRDRAPAGGAPGTPGPAPVDPAGLGGRDTSKPAPINQGPAQPPAQAPANPVPPPATPDRTSAAPEPTTSSNTTVAAAPVTTTPAPTSSTPVQPPAPIIDVAPASTSAAVPSSSTTSRTNAAAESPRPAPQVAEPVPQPSAASAPVQTTPPPPASSTPSASTAAASPAPTQPQAPAPASATPANTTPSGAYSASTGAPTPATGNLVQVAAVSQIARGRELQRQLREAGFDAYWESVKTKTGDVIRVRVSIDPATQTMAETIARLKAMGYDPIVVAQ
jgi:Flp pilus assembly secretin CpaC/cell division septation protein DedD